MSDLNLFLPEKKKTSSRRNDKVGCRIKECFAEALLRDDIPPLANHPKTSKLLTSVTITHVDLSPDLRNAKVFFIPLGGLFQEETLLFFDLQVHYFKNIIAKKINMKYIPNLLFRVDKSFEYSNKINDLLET